MTERCIEYRARISTTRVWLTYHETQALLWDRYHTLRKDYRASHVFRLVTVSETPTQILPLEVSMPWNCAICATERPTAEEPMEVLEDTAHRILAVCQRCYEGVCAQCMCCAVRLRNPATTDAQEHNVCFECTEHHFLCSSCNLQHNTERRQTLPDGTTQCRNCFQRVFRTCRACGGTSRLDEMDGEECARCARGRVIHQHSYKPRAKMHGAGPLYMGVELEVECGEIEPADTADAVVNGLGGGFVYAKYDGSIHRGFELVSHPFSWDWLQPTGRKLWEKLLAKLRSQGCRSYDTQTCGMHVHVSRKALDVKQLLRLQRLAHNNPDLIHMLSRRRRENLNQWANPRDTNLTEQMRLARGVQGHKERRYAAINVTEHTVEIRIFRGTCDDTGFFGNLEAVRSLVEFSKQEGGVFPRAKDYFTFLKEHKAEYPDLIGTILKEGALAK